MSRVVKVRDVLSALRDQGARPLRTRGSHQIWRTESGVTVVVVVNHKNDNCSPIILANVKRAGIAV
jgi:predicted RNA binding protein YcfA (HicA-like mRNA interferase family)